MHRARTKRSRQSVPPARSDEPAADTYLIPEVGDKESQLHAVCLDHLQAARLDDHMQRISTFFIQRVSMSSCRASRCLPSRALDALHAARLDVHRPKAGREALHHEVLCRASCRTCMPKTFPPLRTRVNHREHIDAGKNMEHLGAWGIGGCHLVTRVVDR